MMVLRPPMFLCYACLSSWLANLVSPLHFHIMAKIEMEKDMKGTNVEEQSMRYYFSH